MKGFGGANIEETWTSLTSLLVRRTDPVQCLYVLRQLDKGDISVLVRSLRVSCADVNHEDTLGWYRGFATSEHDVFMRNQVGLRLERLAAEPRILTRGLYFAEGLEMNGLVMNDDYQEVNGILIAKLRNPSLDSALVCTPYKE